MIIWKIKIIIIAFAIQKIYNYVLQNITQEMLQNEFDNKTNNFMFVTKKMVVILKNFCTLFWAYAPSNLLLVKIVAFDIFWCIAILFFCCFYYLWKTHIIEGVDTPVWTCKSSIRKFLSNFRFVIIRNILGERKTSSNTGQKINQLNWAKSQMIKNSKLRDESQRTVADLKMSRYCAIFFVIKRF